MFRSSTTVVLVAVVLVLGTVAVSATSISSALNAAVSQGRRAKEAQGLQSEVDLASKFLDSLSTSFDFKVPSQAELRRSLGNARRAAPSSTGTCVGQNCLAVNAACEDPFKCKCTDEVLLPCFFAALVDQTLTTEERGVNISNCFPAFNDCADLEGGNCIQSKNVCSQLYLIVGPTLPFWNSTWTTTNCENAPATFVAQNCQFNYFCNNASKTCTPHVAVGQPCLYEENADGDNKFEDYRQCGPAPGGVFSDSKFYCANTSRTTGRCEVRDAWRAAGDSCTAATASECFTGTCTNNKCTGRTQGSTCSFSQECSAGLYCEKAFPQTCVPVKAFNESCVPGGAVVRNGDEEEEDGNPCAYNSICLTSTNKCGLLFQGTVGSPCTLRDECPWGTHYCSPTGCALIPATRTACDILNGDDDCVAAWGNKSSCECVSPGTANPPARSYYCEQELAFSASSKDVALAAINCSGVNGCSGGISVSADSCFVRECLTEWQCLYPFLQTALQTTLGNCLDFGPLNPGACPTPPPPPSDSSGATLTAAVVVLATSLLAALF